MSVIFYDDAQNAFHEVKRAALAGDATAQFKLAELYQSGVGCTRNSSAAYRWFLRSAEQEYAPAELELAFMYLLGFGVERSTKLAGHYLFRASKHNLAQAQFVLGALLANGKIFKRSLRQAQYWLTTAQAAGHVEASVELKRLLASLPDDSGNPRPPHKRPFPNGLDITSSPISETERQLAYEYGVEEGRKCAVRGFGRYKKRLASKSRLPNEVDLLKILDAVYELSLDSAERRGYLDEDSADGIERLCDGSDPCAVAYKAAFMEGITAGVEAGVYGDPERDTY